MEVRPLILLLENDESDVFFFRRALSACHAEVDVRIVETVSQARDYLENKGTFGDRLYYRRPDLIITDFKMHGQSGVEFIRWLVKNQNYKEIPVVMYSGTALPQDRDAALASGAVAFHCKSGDFRQVCDTILAMLNFLPKK